MRSKIKNLTFAFTIVGFILMANVGYAQSYKNEVGFITDNDYYISSKHDRYYTEGSFVYYRHALKQENIHPKIEKKIIDFEMGQKLYNSYWSHVPDPNMHDRPFAGYAYASAAMSWLYKSESVLKASAQLGMLGPSAMGKETQTFFHKEVLKAYYTVEGWQYQVKNELGLNLDLSYQHLFYHSKNRLIDISGTSALQLGNTFSGANAGLIIRFGKMNRFYESSSVNSRIKNKSGDTQKTPLEIFLFTKPQLNFAAYDGTIQGGLFRADKGPVTFGIKHWVYVQQIGLNFAWKRFSSKAIVTLKTKEVQSNAKAYQYASGTFAYHFN